MTKCLRVADDIASEHVQVMTDRDDWFLENMTCYGALFLGPRTNVANGDKVIGTNHTLPTKKAGRYTGGLVGRQVPEDPFLSEGPDATRQPPLIGEYGSRLCMLEGFVGHAEQCNHPGPSLWRRAMCPTGRPPNDDRHTANKTLAPLRAAMYDFE